jgi:hypothetical protein
VSEEQGCRCQGCGRLYRVDVLVSDELWKLIRPAGKTGGGGLLCGPCITSRIEDLEQFDAFQLVHWQEVFKSPAELS